MRTRPPGEDSCGGKNPSVVGEPGGLEAGGGYQEEVTHKHDTRTGMCEGVGRRTWTALSGDCSVRGLLCERTAL